MGSHEHGISLEEMEDSRGTCVVGRVALIGSLAAILGLLAYDLVVALFPSVAFGTATLGAGGALAPLSRNLGIPQILLAVVLLAFSGYLGGVIVGLSPLRRLDQQVESRSRTILVSAALGAVAVGIGSLWLAVVPLGIAFLLSSSMGNLLLPFAGYFVVGLLGGSIVGVARVVWPSRDVGGDAEAPTLFHPIHRGVSTFFLKPITISMALSWLVVPGLLMAAAAVSPPASEVVISVVGSVFFGFWAAFALTAIANLRGLLRVPAMAGISLVGFPAGAVAALLGNSLCHSVGSGGLGEPASSGSLEGMFLFWMSVPIGAFAGLFGVPFAFLLYRAVRPEWMLTEDERQKNSFLFPTGLMPIVLVGLFVTLFSTSVVARFYVESGERLVNAVAEGDLKAAQRTLAAGADPNHTSPTGWTPLSTAVDKNLPEMVELLLRVGANPSDRGRTKSLLFRAAQLESSDMVGLLLAADADPNEAVFRGLRPIDSGAASFEVVRLLLEAGADPNPREGLSPLRAAISKGNPEGARLMLAAGADPDPEVRSPRSKPIYIAIERGYTDLLNDLITRGATFDWDSEDSRELLSEVAERGKTDVVAFLIDHGVDMDADLALHEALGKSQEETAILMIEKGANVHLTNERGSTPLHIAAWYRMFAASELLLTRGADANAVTPEGDTPLHFVCGSNFESRTREMIELLLNHGADAHIHNEARQTAYDESSRYEKKIIDEFEDARRTQHATH